MNNKIFLSIKFVIIIIFLVGYSFYFSKASFAQSCITFKEIYYDFGEIDFGEIIKNGLLTHIFEFENTGSSILTIEKIESD